MNNAKWVDSYRPNCIKDCVLPKDIKKMFETYVKDKHLPDMILTGEPGVGKTTVAMAALSEMGYEWYKINASLQRNIDTLRNEIADFASSVSFYGGKKYVLLDEADYLNPQSFQPALRGFMDDYASNCGFILTCNYPNKIIDALHSRCEVVNFVIPKQERPAVAAALMKSCINILKQENIPYENDAIVAIIQRYFPDNRRVINALQRYARVNGKIDIGILSSISEEIIVQLIKLLKNKDFTAMRAWVVENIDQGALDIMRMLYNKASEMVKPSSIPQLVVKIADYQYKAAFVADQEVNLVAFLTEAMVDTEWQ